MPFARVELEWRAANLAMKPPCVIERHVHITISLEDHHGSVMCMTSEALSEIELLSTCFIY